jgi:hypothetical protein
MTLTILTLAQTPADEVRQNKIAESPVLDLSNTNASVFDSSAFSNKLENPGHFNSSAQPIPQNDVGIPLSSVTFLNT